MVEEEGRSQENLGSGTPEGNASGGEDLGRSHESHGDSQLTPEPLEGKADKSAGNEEMPLASPSAERHPLHVTLPAYDGPLDLLLDLIKKNEMDIYNIQIAEITRQYLESLELMRQLDLEVAGEFIVLAATLIYIKSRMLLPQDGTNDDDEEGDPRAELVRKLLEYQAFKEAAKKLGVLEGERGKVFTRQITDYYLADLNPEDVGIDTFSASLFDLLSAFQGVLAKITETQTHEVFEQEISIEEKIAEIRGELEKKGKIYFSQLFKETWTRNYLIATFLAVLELIRTRSANCYQESHFGEIVIEKCETPLQNSPTSS